MYIYIYINSSSNYILYFVGLSVIFLINVASFHGMFPLAFSSAESSQRFQSNWKSAILPRICFQKVLLGIDTKAFIRMVGWLDLGPVAQVFIFVEVAMWIDLPLHQARSVCCVVQPYSVDKGLRIHDNPLDHSARNKPISMLKLRMKVPGFSLSVRDRERMVSHYWELQISVGKRTTLYWLYLWGKELMLSGPRVLILIVRMDSEDKSRTWKSDKR